MPAGEQRHRGSPPLWGWGWPGAAAAAAVFLVGLALPAEGQFNPEKADPSDVSEILPCVEALTPCQPEVKKMQVTSACCMPLSDMVGRDPGCICAMFFNSDLLDNFNLTRDRALQVAVQCNVEVTVDYCNRYITGEQAEDLHRMLSPGPFASILSPSGHPGGGIDGSGSTQNGLSFGALAVTVIMSCMILILFDRK